MAIEQLERELNDFDPQVRARALEQLAARSEVLTSAPGAAVNMHCHTFFSYNGYGYSPSALAWLGVKQGLRAMGIVDFDVLDGVDEFLHACDLLGLRGSAGMETRVYLPEYAAREINSPGEPGIYYHMGIGFVSGHAPARVQGILDDMRRRARERNLGVIERVNAYLDPVTIDYQRDVLPLTPAGNATERHITEAYAAAAQRAVGADGDVAGFWAEALGMSRAEVAAVASKPPSLHNLIRAGLMKRGGVGYVQPDGGSFPSVEEVNELVVACGALPCATWLDGTSAGEQAEEDLLGLLIGKGVVALNIVPDRNWNIADPEEKRVKLRNLYAVVALAQALDLPLNIGTEMNRYGLKVVDDMDAPELAPVRQPFLDGAMFIYGHTVAQRALGIGYQSEWARAELPARRARNAFYTALGRSVPPGLAGLALLERVGVQAADRLLRAVS
ncbi:MAG: hypothetical protein JXA09_13780 [Anaerolineae bacterium]|nr:hypothetical protein [Anaerolineae bacterium]